MRTFGALSGLTLCFCLLIEPAARATSVTEFPVPTSTGLAAGITAGPDGALWFTETASGKVGRITTDGTVTEFTIPTPNSGPLFITAGPDQALWFVEAVANKIGRIATTGQITEFTIPTALSIPIDIVTGPDGALWFTEANADKIGRISTDGAITEFPLALHTAPGPIAPGSDGNLWFAEGGASKIGRITTDGLVTEFLLPLSSNNADGIVSGPDGALWFTEQGNSPRIGRITTSGTITEFPFPSPAATPSQIRTGPDGTLWFVEANSALVGRVTLAGAISEFAIPTTSTETPSLTVGPDGAIWFTETGNTSPIVPAKIGRIEPQNTSSSPLVAAVLPSSRSISGGGSATAFATIINSGATTASQCAIVPITGIPASFTYQTTNPKTNALTGSANTPVDIAPGAAQSFVIAFTGNAPFTPTDVQLGFACGNANAAAIASGLDTLLLSASSTPVPDIVALAATTSNDGIVDISSGSGVGAFAVATVNVGAPANITASADTGGATLPVSLSLCQTNPGSGQCLAPPSASVGATFAANATPTFAIFVSQSANVPFAPATNRIFVRFKDAGGVTRGSTSVAVRTQ